MDDAISGIVDNIIPGSRPVPLREITDTISNVYGAPIGKVGRSRKAGSAGKKPVPKFDAGTLDRLITGYEDCTEEDLKAASPLRIPDDTAGHWKIAINQIFKPDEYLFIGPSYGTGDKYVKKVSSWNKIIDRSPAGLPVYPHLILNPLSGVEGFCKDGVTMSYRSDSCVAAFRKTVVEFDDMPLWKQIAFWMFMISINFPVAAVIHSGGKSLHGWVDVSCRDYSEWQTKVEEELFLETLVPLGADRMCRNPSRMSRLPGHFRRDKGQWQRLLYLNPEMGC